MAFTIEQIETNDDAFKKFINETVRGTSQTNILEGKTQFLAIVLTDSTKENDIIRNGKHYYTFRARIIQDEIHDAYPNPCGLDDSEGEAGNERRRIVSLYPLFVSQSPQDVGWFGDKRPQKNSIVWVKSPNGFASEGLYIAPVDGSFINADDEAVEAASSDCQELVGLFDGDSNTLGTPSLLRSLSTFSDSLPVLSEGIIKGVGLPRITSRVREEKKFWEGKKESDPAAYDRLKTYWDNLGNWPEGRWTTTTAWSGAFISYIIKGNGGFVSSASHYEYTTENHKATNAWEVFSITKNPGKIVAQVGDVVGYDGHNDIVYKIEGGYAHTAGGNLSNTVEDGYLIKLDSNGAYTQGRYNFVIKKMR